MSLTHIAPMNPFELIPYLTISSTHSRLRQGPSNSLQSPFCPLGAWVCAFADAQSGLSYLTRQNPVNHTSFMGFSSVHSVMFLLASSAAFNSG